MNIFTFLIMAIAALACPAHAENSSSTKREYDNLGRLIEEEFPNGKSIKINYDEKNRVTQLSIATCGSIFYKYDDTHLVEISRISEDGETTYKHAYYYDSTGGLSSEELISDLGRISYYTDFYAGVMGIRSPYSQEIYKWDANGQIVSHSIDDEIAEYQYDDNNQIAICPTEIQDCWAEYDSDGRLMKKVSSQESSIYEFDENGKLTEITSDRARIVYSYDDFDRRSEKKVYKNGQEYIESYLYFGNNEIAIFDSDGNIKQLRIPGLSFDDDFTLPVAIEIGEELYAPIHDFKGNIAKLINTKTKDVINLPFMDGFGQNLKHIKSPTPWIFSSKHYDADANLVYFGNRYYDPEQKQWISPDPFGTLQHQNVYLYCLGNPLSYFDPDGRFSFTLINLAWGAGAALTFPVWGTTAVVAVTGAAVGWATYEVIHRVKEGKQRDGTPKSNNAQNDQFKDAKKQIEKMIGRKISQDEENRLHRTISGQNYGYHEIIQEGYWLFHGK